MTTEPAVRVGCVEEVDLTPGQITHGRGDGGNSPRLRSADGRRGTGAEKRRS